MVVNPCTYRFSPTQQTLVFTRALPPLFFPRESPMVFCRLQLAAFSCSGSWMPGNGLPPSLPKKRLVKTEERPLSLQYVFPFSATVAEFVREVIWVMVQNIHSNTFTWRDLFVKESAVWKAPGLRMDCMWCFSNPRCYRTYAWFAGLATACGIPGKGRAGEGDKYTAAMTTSGKLRTWHWLWEGELSFSLKRSPFCWSVSKEKQHTTLAAEPYSGFHSSALVRAMESLSAPNILYWKWIEGHSVVASVPGLCGLVVNSALKGLREHSSTEGEKCCLGDSSTPSSLSNQPLPVSYVQQ